ncbi:hypothetical protein ACET3Z_005274 [Daucus carota]
MTEQPEDVKMYIVAEIKEFCVLYIERIIRCQLDVKKVEEKNMRFRLATVYKDSTCILAVLFPHEDIQRILGKEVFDIENDDACSSISFPPLLKTFEKKDFLAKLLISEKNVKKASNVYIAHSLEEPPVMLGDHDPSETNNVVPNPDVLTMHARIHAFVPRAVADDLEKILVVDELDIGNASPTTFHINIQQHSVTQMRKSPTFDKTNLYMPTNALPTLSHVAMITNSAVDKIELQFLAQVRIIKVKQVNSWYHDVCTSCYKVASPVGNVFQCQDCKRNIAYPDKKCDLVNV